MTKGQQLVTQEQLDGLVARAHRVVTWIVLCAIFATFTTAWTAKFIFAASYRGGGDGAAGALMNVVEDLTPQLGGDLDMNGNSIIDNAGNMVIGNGSAGQTLTFDMATGSVSISASGMLAALSLAGSHRLGNILLGGELITRAADGSASILFAFDTTMVISGSDNDSATAVGIQMGPQASYSTDGAKLVVFCDDVKDACPQSAAIYGNGEIQAGAIEADAPAVNVVCDNDAVGIRVYVDDTNDGNPGRNCYCTDVDDGSTFDYRDANGVTNAVCDQI